MRRVGQEKVPLRGEIWFLHLPTDPPEKGERPVIVVSADYRNRSERAETVLVVPMSTSVHRDDIPCHLVFEPGQTGLQDRSIAKAEDITTVRKQSLHPPRETLRRVSNAQICELAKMVALAMDCSFDED